MLNIETKSLHLIRNIDYTKLQKYFDYPIPKNFEETSVLSCDLFMFRTIPVCLSLFGYTSEYVQLKHIAKELKTNIIDAYLKYVPYIIQYKLKSTLPYPEAISCNSDGIIKIVHYKKFLK